MSKTIQSPVPEFPGFIVVPDSLNLRQVSAWQQAVDSSIGMETTQAVLTCLPATLDCIEEFRIEHQPAKAAGQTFGADRFVFTPADAATKLFFWAFREVSLVIFGPGSEANLPAIGKESEQQP